jgi:hypothetical protein
VEDIIDSDNSSQVFTQSVSKGVRDTDRSWKRSLTICPHPS